MNPIRSSGYCDNCGRMATLYEVYENPHKPYPTAWYCEYCAERFSKGWIGSTEPTIIDGSKCIPTVFGGHINPPSVWIAIEEQDKKKEESSQKEILCLLNSLRSSLYNECECYSDYYGEGCGHSSDRLEAVEEILRRLRALWNTK